MDGDGMSIRADGVSAITVGELLAEDLRIPSYQRPFSWRPATVLRLVEDLQQARTDWVHRGVPYVLGAVILHSNNGTLDVVDGQQRLLTLRMMLAILNDESVGVDPAGENPVAAAWNTLSLRIRAIQGDDAHEFRNFVGRRCHLVRVVTDDVDEAFRVFDSQNYRGKPLAPHDLLKAHHLREMVGESDATKAAVVETWESSRDSDLDRLFSTYLYRIARWSRGESAPRFTAADVDMFKGITARSSSTPSARYHLAAQTVMPMLNALEADGARSTRDAGRSRFQLDAPVAAGRSFFEMVDFMLAELNALAKDAFVGDLEPFITYDVEQLRQDGTLDERASHSRYRYVTELFLAALLYYTNKFGDHHVDETREDLFAWAYALRLRLRRVQFRSVDNEARGAGSQPSVFTALRNTDSRSTGSLITAPQLEPLEGQEGALAALLTAQGRL